MVCGCAVQRERPDAGRTVIRVRSRACGGQLQLYSGTHTAVLIHRMYGLVQRKSVHTGTAIRNPIDQCSPPGGHLAARGVAGTGDGRGPETGGEDRMEAQSTATDHSAQRPE